MIMVDVISHRGAYIIVYVNKLLRCDNLQNNQVEVLSKITDILSLSTSNY